LHHCQQLTYFIFFYYVLTPLPTKAHGPQPTPGTPFNPALSGLQQPSSSWCIGISSSPFIPLLLPCPLSYSCVWSFHKNLDHPTSFVRRFFFCTVLWQTDFRLFFLVLWRIVALLGRGRVAPKHLCLFAWIATLGNGVIIAIVY
jgi:hypothetical protein